MIKFDDDSMKVFMARNYTEEDSKKGKRFWNLKYQRIVEVDPDNRVASSNRDEEPKFTWVPSNVTWDNGVTSASVVGVATLKSGATVTVRNDVFRSTGQVTIQNVTANVVTSRLKMSWIIDNYNFLSSDNKLAFRIKINDNSRDEKECRDDGHEGSGRSKKRRAVLTGDASNPAAAAAIDFETVAYLADGVTPVDVNVTQSGNIYHVVFSSFSNKLIYDPEVYAYDDSSKFPIAAVVGGAVGGLVAVVASVVIYKKMASKKKNLRMVSSVNPAAGAKMNDAFSSPNV